jgi:type II secretory pathway pseudopilin PulG
MALWVTCQQQWRSRGPSTSRLLARSSALRHSSGRGQLVIWLWVPVVYGIARLPPVALIGYLLATVWTAVLFTAALRRNDVTTRWVLADVAVAVACAVIVSRTFPAGQAASPRSWVLGPICGVGVTCAFFASRWIAAWSVGAIAIAWMAGTWQDIRAVGAILVLSGCAVIVVFSLVAALAARVLFRAATQADQAASAALEAQRREAMAEARDEERRQQFKVLHDNVLHTLESIARGELAIGSQRVRQTCMRDADYLRGLITGGADSIPTDLGVALAGRAGTVRPWACASTSSSMRSPSSSRRTSRRR